MGAKGTGEAKGGDEITINYGVSEKQLFSTHYMLISMNIHDNKAQKSNGWSVANNLSGSTSGKNVESTSFDKRDAIIAQKKMQDSINQTHQLKQDKVGKKSRSEDLPGKEPQVTPQNLLQNAPIQRYYVMNPNTMKIRWEDNEPIPKDYTLIYSLFNGGKEGLSDLYLDSSVLDVEPFKSKLDKITGENYKVKAGSSKSRDKALSIFPKAKTLVRKMSVLEADAFRRGEVFAFAKDSVKWFNIDEPYTFKREKVAERILHEKEKDENYKEVLVIHLSEPLKEWFMDFLVGDKNVPKHLKEHPRSKKEGGFITIGIPEGIWSEFWKLAGQSSEFIAD